MYSFSKVNIPIGSLLTYILDEDVKVLVVSDSYVSYDGKVMSLSGLTLLLMSKNGKKRKSIRGTAYWKFENKKLSELI